MSVPEPKVAHHEGCGIRSCPIFPELRPILDEAFEIFGDKSEFVVAAPQYCSVAKVVGTLRCAVLKIKSVARRSLADGTAECACYFDAGVSGWPRLFHTVTLREGRAIRQTELQREFPIHVVCSWLGNSPQVGQQSYLLITEDDFAKATGVAKVMVEG